MRVPGGRPCPQSSPPAARSPATARRVEHVAEALQDPHPSVPVVCSGHGKISAGVAVFGPKAKSTVYITSTKRTSPGGHGAPPGVARWPASIIIPGDDEEDRFGASLLTSAAPIDTIARRGGRAAVVRREGAARGLD